MTCLMRIPFMLILAFVSITLVQATEPETLDSVPHNNGTHGLLKNTYIEPLDNFHQTLKPPVLQEATDLVTESSDIPVDEEALIEDEQ
ncbi:hypothetical protein [Psychromonas aquatilis]|uniref:Secreted protein n=1 Tax=Psychromonas aquatilis TaxID=2005072 RepID=A0ABU9GM89_9GAMM